MPNIGEPVNVVTSNGTYSHTTGTSEETALEILENLKDVTVAFDVSLMAQDFTIRIKEKMDGTNYEVQSQSLFPDDYDTGIESIVINLQGKGRDQIITFQSVITEGSDRDIPFSRRDVGITSK